MRGFGHILWTLGAGAAVLSFYLVSLQVASSRAELERVEREIALATRDIRTLETEIGTRGRLSQLERWNVNFLRLSAPEAEQFVGDAYKVAAMTRPERPDVFEGPIIYAEARPTDDYGELLVQASYEASEGENDTVEGAGPDAASPDVEPATPTRPDTELAEAKRDVDPLAPLPTGEDGDASTP